MFITVAHFYGNFFISVLWKNVVYKAVLMAAFV